MRRTFRDARHEPCNRRALGEHLIKRLAGRSAANPGEPRLDLVARRRRASRARRGGNAPRQGPCGCCNLLCGSFGHRLVSHPCGKLGPSLWSSLARQVLRVTQAGRKTGKK